MKIFEKIKDKLPFKKSTENSTYKKNKKQEKNKSKLKTFINILAYVFGGIFLIVLLFSCVNSCKGNNNNEDNKKSLNNIQYKENDTPLLIDFNPSIEPSIDNSQELVSEYNYNDTPLLIDFNPSIAPSVNPSVTPPIDPSQEPEPSIEPSIDNSQELVSEYNYNDTIVFNNAFDWRILFSGGYQKNTGLFFLNSDYAIANPVVHFTGMEFVCDNVLYNTIDITLIVCDNASVVYTGYDNEGKQIEYVVNTSNLFSYNSDKSLCAIAGVFYRYYNGSVDNFQNVTNQVHVYNGTQINYIAPSTEGGSTYVQSVNYNIHEWLSNSYKKLLIVSASNEGANSLYSNISTYELITNNENLVITEYGELGDVFSLLGGGFTALTSVFGIYILPNISIGVLIFLPLVVVMFITIIRLIKK